MKNYRVRQSHTANLKRLQRQATGTVLIQPRAMSRASLLRVRRGKLLYRMYLFDTKLIIQHLEVCGRPRGARSYGCSYKSQSPMLQVQPLSTTTVRFVWTPSGGIQLDETTHILKDSAPTQYYVDDMCHRKVWTVDTRQAMQSNVRQIMQTEHGIVFMHQNCDPLALRLMQIPRDEFGDEDFDVDHVEEEADDTDFSLRVDDELAHADAEEYHMEYQERALLNFDTNRVVILQKGGGK